MPRIVIVLPPRRELIGMLVGAIIAVVIAVAVSKASSPETAVIAVGEDDVFSAVGIGRMLVSTVIAAGIGYFVWWLQSRSTRKRVKEHKEAEDRLAEDLETANKEKERIAQGHEELLERVTRSEQTLGNLREQLGLMEQQARPLFEAAKIRLIQSLTHPDEEFEVPDALLKLTLGPDGYITDELAALLKERETSTHPDVTPEEKLAAAILPSVVELAAIEAKVIGPITSQLVSSPVAEPHEPKK